MPNTARTKQPRSGLAVAVRNCHDVPMTSAATSKALARLGDAIRDRRKSQGLTVRQAASQMPNRAGRSFSASAWSAIENARNSGPSHPGTYADIEDVVGWDRGSCAAVLAGGSPTEKAPVGQAAAPVVTELSTPGDRLMIIVASWTEIDELAQRRMVEIARAAHEKAQGGTQGDNRAAR